MSKKNDEEIKEELKPTEEVNQELKFIEEIAKELEIKESILAGVMASKNWKNGKVLSKEELEKALLEFLNKTL